MFSVAGYVIYEHNGIYQRCAIPNDSQYDVVLARIVANGMRFVEGQKNFPHSELEQKLLEASRTVNELNNKGNAPAA